MVDLVLFPSSYFSIKKVDEDLQSEYEAVKATGLFDIVLFGYDKWITEFPRFFDASVTQEEFDKWMQVFYKYRGDLLTGGICVKEFLDLKFYGSYSNEYRVFYACNEIVTVSRNSGQPDYAPEPPKEMIEKYKHLPSCYYTVDYAELADGTWKVMEAGDGSVSGLSERQNVEQYFRALYYVWNG